MFSVSRVSYAYQRVPALRDISLEIPRGQRVALLGANGSGKSTLLRLLAGLGFPDEGRISFRDEPLTQQRLDEREFFYRFRRAVGVIFQNPDVQLFNASVFDEVAFGPLQLGWPAEKIRAAVAATLEQLRIADLKDRPPYRLSGGEKKRVAIASVLVVEPDVLLLDEPTAALDPASQRQMVELLASWKGTGRTVVTATHDLDSLEEIADYAVLLGEGRVAGQGDPLEILHNTSLLEGAGLIHRHTHSHPHLHQDDAPDERHKKSL